ncbi:MAG: histidine kinase with domain [Acidimicrobiales bacterium]|nr:histidine kinase with domain [Acidimicrobiales bacterium]
MAANPLQRLRSIKVKFSVVIVAAVGVTLMVNEVGIQLNFRPLFRGGVAAIIALAMVQLMSRGMTSPLRSMERAATSMAAGNVSERIETTSADEVGRLAIAFNLMADELAEVDRQRRDLVANVSHELRTPISALRATLENVVDEVVPPDPALLRTMLAQTERLQRLVTQLLDLSRLESGVTPLHLLPFPAADLLEAVADESALHSPDLSFRVEVDPPDLALVGDPERLHQLFANLADNAARFTPDGGEVVLTARRQDAVVRFEVLDDGPGIPPEALSRVFERFYRTDEARSTDEGGSGLGLAIARWVVDLHAGRIRAEQRARGGCRMVVELPDDRPGDPVTR